MISLSQLLKKFFTNINIRCLEKTEIWSITSGMHELTCTGAQITYTDSVKGSSASCTLGKSTFLFDTCTFTSSSTLTLINYTLKGNTNVTAARTDIQSHDAPRKWTQMLTIPVHGILQFTYWFGCEAREDLFGRNKGKGEWLQDLLKTLPIKCKTQPRIEDNFDKMFPLIANNQYWKRASSIIFHFTEKDLNLDQALHSELLRFEALKEVHVKVQKEVIVTDPSFLTFWLVIPNIRALEVQANFPREFLEDSNWAQSIRMLRSILKLVIVDLFEVRYGESKYTKRKTYEF